MKKVWPILIALYATTAGAASFLVPSDEALVRASRAIVVATAGSSYARYAPGGWIETVTTMHVEDPIKGSVGSAIEVTELGGTVNGMTYVVPGSPQYANGERVLLFLETNDRGEWVAKNMAVGKFAFSGSNLVRDSSELFGWDSDTGMPHREPLRDAAKFLRYVRDVAAGRTVTADYVVPPNNIQSQSLKPAPLAVSPTTYLLQGTGGQGFRWNVFPTPVTFLSHGTQPGALGGGLTALNRGLAAWSTASGANIRYQNGGTTSVSATHLCDGCGGPDGVNSVQFNDPSQEIPGSFTPTGGATLAVGGAWTDGSTHVGPAGETFLTIVEADLVVQDGISGPGLTGPGFDHVLTHELGHTLGLRHSDTPPPGGTSTTQAIMNSSVDFNNDGMGSTLQPWDLEAVDAVYGSGAVTPPPCNGPTITSQPKDASTINTPVNLTVIATGDAPLQYQWFIGQSGNTSQPVSDGNAALLTVQPKVTTQYWVRVSNNCSTINSVTVTVTVNGCPAVVINALSLSTLIIQGKSTTLTASAAGGSGITYQWFIGNPGTTTTPAGSGASVSVTPNTTTTYFVRATNSCGAFADSDVVVVTVQPCTAPAILIQPSSGDALNGSTVVLFVGDTGSKPETYQWFQGEAQDTSNPVPSGLFASFTTPALFASASFWVRITNDCGTIDSQVAHLNVVSTCRPAIITAQPQNQTVVNGGSALLHVEASGTSLGYQWYQGAAGDARLPVGGSSSTLMTPAITGTTQFWVKVTSPCGASANSTTVTVTTAARRRPSRG